MGIRTAAALAALVSLVAASDAAGAIPSASTGGAKSVTASSAVLTGTVNPNSEPTTFYFEFGTTKGYGSRTPAQGPTAAVKQNIAASATVSGLAPGTTYHFRLVALNGSGTKLGGDKTFGTPGSISLAGSPSAVLFGRPTTLSGQLATGGVAGVKVTLREDPFPFKGFKASATTRTDPSGRFSFSRTPPLNTAYQAIADTRPRATSATFVVRVRMKVTLALNTSRPKAGERVAFHGSVTPAHNGQLIKIQKRVGNAWRTVKRTTLTPSRDPLASQFRKKVRIRSGGLYRAYVPHDADHASGSAKRRIRTR